MRPRRTHCDRLSVAGKYKKATRAQERWCLRKGEKKMYIWCKATTWREGRLCSFNWYKKLWSSYFMENAHRHSSRYSSFKGLEKSDSSKRLNRTCWPVLYDSALSSWNQAGVKCCVACQWYSRQADRSEWERSLSESQSERQDEHSKDVIKIFNPVSLEMCLHGKTNCFQ